MGILDHSGELPTRPLVLALVLASGLGLAYLIWLPVYNIFFHPLSSYPGPKLWAVTRIPYTFMFLSGRGHKKILQLHQTYGPIVRVAPNQLSYNHPDTSKEIRGHRRTGMVEHGKDPVHLGPHIINILGAPRENHTRQRRILAHGFSNQVMLEQEPLIRKYVDLLLEQLQKNSAGGTKMLDIAKWYNYTTFDVIGDLSFGEPFGCLETSTYHPWVQLIYTGLKNRSYLLNADRYPLLAPLLKKFIPKEIASKFLEHQELSKEKVRKRLATVTDRPDFMNAMTQPRKGDELTFEELCSNAAVLIIAGSETTATALSAATYYLGMNPRVMELVVKEIRSTFATEDEINLVSVQKLSYMLAMFDETLRIYPPVPLNLPRLIAEGGDTILGRFVPENTIIDLWPWAMQHNPKYITQPEEFIPERWLGDPRYAKDRLEIVEPFSSGPRNCIGRNLAYSEMRLILARVLFRFDIQLSDDSKGWEERSNAFVMWEKGPVNVYLTPRDLNAEKARGTSN